MVLKELFFLEFKQFRRVGFFYAGIISSIIIGILLLFLSYLQQGKIVTLIYRFFIDFLFIFFPFIMTVPFTVYCLRKENIIYYRLLPVSLWSLLLIRLILFSMLSVVFILVCFFSIVISSHTIGSGIDISVWRFVAATTFASFCYSSVFMFITVASHNSSYIFSLAYILIVEFIGDFLEDSSYFVSIRKSVYTFINTTNRVGEGIGGNFSVIVIPIILAIACTMATFIIMDRRELSQE